MWRNVAYLVFVSIFMIAFSAAGARATTITCPSHMTVNGRPYANLFNFPFGVAQPLAGGDLVCSYTVSFSGSTSAKPTFSCPTIMLAYAVSGGTGTWSFGPPGTSAVIALNPLPRLPGMVQTCSYLSGRATLSVWQAPPTNVSSCAPSKTDSHQYVCQPPVCPSPLTGAQIPTNDWSANSTKPGYYALDSAIIDTANGQVTVGSASLSTIKQQMGSAFAGAKFAVVGGAGTASNLPANVIICPYDGPGFSYGGKPLTVTLTIACTTTCGSIVGDP